MLASHGHQRLRIAIISKISQIGLAVQNEVQKHPWIFERVDILPFLDDAAADLLLEIQAPKDQDVVLEGQKLKNIIPTDAEIVLGDPQLVSGILGAMANLKWCQSTFAGVNLLMHPSLRRDYKLTRSGGVMGPHMAQYVLGWIIAFERKFFLAREYQHRREWRPAECRYRHFGNVTVGILGLGDIGHCIANHLQLLGFNVIGYRRRGRQQPLSSDRNTSQKELTTVPLAESLESLLSNSDYVISVLPSTPATKDLLSNGALRSCGAKRAVLINVGRGDIISEIALNEALNKQWISSAVLDVFSTEPLPTDSPLWNNPQIHITPHVAALSLPEDIARAFVKNLSRFLSEPKGDDTLLYEVDWESGY